MTADDGKSFNVMPDSLTADGVTANNAAADDLASDDRTTDQINQLCGLLDLGNLISQPEQVFGGLLHKMYQVKTDRGNYAVKALNPLIMQRQTAMPNYIFSEKVSRMASGSGIPALPAIGRGKTVHHVNGAFYMAFNWVDAASIKPEQVRKSHCVKVGKILADLHTLDFSGLTGAMQAPSVTVTDWKGYIEPGSALSTLLMNRLDRLYQWEMKANAAANQVLANQIISHRDMDCKNVLWDKYDNPIVIDWEASGYTNPLTELVDVATAWAGIESKNFNQDHLDSVVRSYLVNGGRITDDISAVLSFGYKGKLEWLEYNLKRVSGIESSNEEERRLGADEVRKTINSLETYTSFLPAFHDSLTRWQSSHRIG